MWMYIIILGLKNKEKYFFVSDWLICIDLFYTIIKDSNHYSVIEN